MARHRLCLYLGIALSLVVGLEAASKYYTGENKPYEFGFTVNDDEQKQQTQHRHEMKDENGIIMGEFGFLTADGVYHVTVYATDENGNFKILSMKNIRTKPFPTAGENKSPQVKSIPFNKSPAPGNPVAQAPQRTTTSGPQVSRNRPVLRPLPEAAPIQSCSSCSIPTSPKPRLTEPADVSRDDPFLSYPEQPNNPRARQFVQNNNPQQQYGLGQQNFGQEQRNLGDKHQKSSKDQQNFGTSKLGEDQREQGKQSFNGQRNQIYDQGQHNLGLGQNIPSEQGHNVFGNGPAGLQVGRQPGKFVKQPEQFGQPGQLNIPGSFRQSGVQRGQGVLGSKPGQDQFGQQPGSIDQTQGRTEGFGGQNGQSYYENVSPEAKPKLISAQIQVVDKNTDVNKLNPGEKPGLPNGLKKDNMLQLLYTFNYTVGFHAHHEEGYTNGVKKGYYYVTGRDGIRSRIDYVADSEGFHPQISSEVLDLLSEDVPKPETEKEPKYGLKGYEFKWLYFPPKSQ